jgi:hypothetical protein
MRRSAPSSRQSAFPFSSSTPLPRFPLSIRIQKSERSREDMRRRSRPSVIWGCAFSRRRLYLWPFGSPAGLVDEHLRHNLPDLVPACYARGRSHLRPLLLCLFLIPSPCHLQLTASMDYSKLPTPTACVADFCLIPVRSPSLAIRPCTAWKKLSMLVEVTC